MLPQLAAISQPTGVPVWVDLRTIDAAGARRFYQHLLGWDFLDRPVAGRPAGTVAQVEGHQVAAIGPLPPTAEERGHPSAWTTYLAVDDLGAAVAEARAAGGRVLVAPIPLRDAGRLSILADPQGARFGIWESVSHVGTTLRGPAGSLTGSELLTPDLAGAARFYGRVLGLTAVPVLDDEPYASLRAGAVHVGAARLPLLPRMPARWQVFFAVDDVDRAAERAEAVGGAVLAPPFDGPEGREATLGDPQGAVFSVRAPARC